MWGDSPPDAVRAAWADELGRYEGDDLRGALEACRFSYKDYPPTLFQFADLCTDARRKRMQTTQALPGPKTEMPARIKAQIREFIANHSR